MILLDTNVLSALMQRTPDPQVVEWLDNQPAESIWTSSVTVFEIRTGIELLERGRRRERLEQTFLQLLAEDLVGRVHPFDQAAALAAGSIAATRQRTGRTVEIRDVQIAGIATSRRATLATRNTRHFEETGVRLVNPWNWPPCLPGIPHHTRRRVGSRVASAGGAGRHAPTRRMGGASRLGVTRATGPIDSALPWPW